LAAVDILVGLFVVLGVLGSAVRTVVVPRGEQVLVSAVLFLTVRARSCTSSAGGSAGRTATGSWPEWRPS